MPRTSDSLRFSAPMLKAVLSARDRRLEREARDTARTVALGRLKRLRHFRQGDGENVEAAAARFVTALAGASAALARAVDSDDVAAIETGDCDDEIPTQGLVLALMDLRLDVVSPRLDPGIVSRLAKPFAQALALEVDVAAFVRRVLDELTAPASPNAAPSKHGRSTSSLRKLWLAQAMLLVQSHPDRSDAAVAREVGVDRSTLSRSKEYKAARSLARGNPPQDRPGLRGGRTRRRGNAARNDG